MKRHYFSFLIALSLITSCSPASTVIVNPDSSSNVGGGLPLPITSNTSASISGRVTTLDGSADSSTKLELYKDNKLAASTDLTTGGSYSFNNVASGTGYSIKVKSNGYNDFWFYNINVDNNSKLNLEQINLIPVNTALSPIKGFVQNYDLSSLSGTLVKAFNSAGLLLSTALVNSNGEYNLNLPVGTGYYFEFLKDNYDKFIYRNIDINSVASLKLDNILLALKSQSTENNVQGSIVLPDISLNNIKLPIKVYRNYDSLKYLAYTLLSDLNGMYNFNLPKGSYFFETLYNGKVYTSNNFVVSTGNNLVNNISFNPIKSEANSVAPSVVTSASPSPTVTPIPTFTPTPTPIAVSTPKPNTPYFVSPGTILFTRGFGIHKIEPNNYESKVLAFSSGSGAMNARVSPDKSKVVYLSNSESLPNGSGVRPNQILTMNIDGTNQKLITTDGQWYDSPSWSPDGTKLVFSKNVDAPDVQYKGYLNHYEIFTSNVDGTNQVKLTTSPNKAYVNFISGDWSADGSKIVYTSNIDGINNIYTMNNDGSNIVRLTNIADTNTSFYEPRWSPDGKKILYSKGLGDNSRDIFVMNSDGSNEVQLTNDRKSGDNTIGSSYPSWSPDGTKIVYMSNKEKYYGAGENAANGYQLYVMNADGSNQTRISFDNTANMFPEWVK